MNDIRRIDDMDISINHDEIATLLGYGDSGIPERVKAIVDEIDVTAPRLLSPACAYRVMTKDDVDSPFLRSVDDLVACLVTIGPNLESDVKRHKQNDELTRALILDVYGSAAAEATAAAANAVIVKEVDDMGLRCSRRFSPGYGGWAVDEQRWLLPVLEADALGVSLTNGCMMNPRKSITFAVTIGVDPVEMRTDDICESCGALNCRMRHTPEKCFGRNPL